MRKTPLTIAEFGDIHLGNPNTPTESIVAGLMRALPDNALTGEIDLIILAGDVFDRQLGFGDTQIGEIQIFIHYLLKLCKRWDIVLRILEGTPSHDWRQSRTFETLNTVSGMGVDLKYVSTLHIEHIDKWDIDVLYVPDEWRPHCDDTWVEVNQLLSQQGLTQVDFAVMHGCFPHQMPEMLHKQLDMHRSDRYLSIVRELIFVGHIHRHSQFDRILAAGSFDRLCHGEEEPKGHLHVVCHTDMTYDIRLVTNVAAKLYKTIDCTGLEGSALNDHLAYSTNKAVDGSAFRLLANRTDAAIASLDVINVMYPQYIWTTKLNKSDTQEKPMLVLENKQKVVSLNRDTLKTLLLERIGRKYPDQLNLCASLIHEVIP